MLADISRLLKDIKIKGDIKNYDDVIDTFGETLLHAASACVNRKGWILDSGASSSYTCDHSIFVPGSLKSHTGRVLVGNGQYMCVNGVGDVCIEALRDNTVDKIILHDVLLVPDLMCNLISLMVVTSRSCTYSGTGDYLVVKKGDRTKLIGKRNSTNNVLVLVQETMDPTANICVNMLETSSTCLLTASTASTASKASLDCWIVTPNSSSAWSRPNQLKVSN